MTDTEGPPPTPDDDAFSVTPGTVYKMDSWGGSGAVMDAIYTGPGIRRVVENIGPSYLTEAREGETHVQFSIRVPDAEGEPFYIDPESNWGVTDA